MTAPLRTLLPLLALLALASPPAAAQAVRGDVRDQEHARPLAGARLLLLNEAGATVDSTFTDAAGRFRLAAPAPGSYTVYFAMDGWAGVPSEPLRLDAGKILDYEFRVTLVSNEAIRQMSDIIGMEPRLQQALPEICGEAFRPWEAGLLIGSVRAAGTGERIAGARVAVAGPAAGRSTVSSENGIYVLCNVPVGAAVGIVTTTPQGAADTTRVEIRAGTASWYDLYVRSRRR